MIIEHWTVKICEKIVQKLFNVQLSLGKAKRRRFRWERTIETAFRAYERSGRGREIKSINCYEAIRREFVAGYRPAISSEKYFSPCCAHLMHEECHEWISRHARGDVTAYEE